MNTKSLNVVLQGQKQPKNNPEQVIIHVTNDLLLKKSSEPIATSILLLAQNTTSDNVSVSVSSIIQRNGKWKNKMC